MSGCTQGGGTGTTPSPDAATTKTFVSPEYGFAITYDASVFPKAERVAANRVLGPARPDDWSGFYARHLLLSTADGDSGVLNVAFVDDAEPTSGVFVSASHRDQTGTIVSQVEAMGQGFSNLFVAGEVFSPGPTPAAVSIAGLRGFQVVVPAKKVTRHFSGLDPGLLKGMDYVFYGLFDREYQYAICVFAPHDRRAELQPSLTAAANSFRRTE